MKKSKAVYVEWTEDGMGRICPNCKHTTYYCSNVRGGFDEEFVKQPDNYCCKCGQKFIREKFEIKREK